MTSKAKTPVKKPTAKKTTAASAAPRKTTAVKVAAPEPAASTVSAAAKAPPAAPPVVVESPQAVITGPVLRKRELIELVVEKSGIKKKDAKPVIEAMLSILGEAVGDNRELNLHPFGKVKVRRAKEMPNGRVLVTKIRQSLGNKLPEAAE